MRWCFAWLAKVGGSFEPMYDFYFPVKVRLLAQPYDPGSVVNRFDICYPPLVMMWEWLFSPDFYGGLVCTSLGLAFFLFGALAVFDRFGFSLRKKALCLLVVGFSMPALFSYYVGNLIFYAAGALNFYLAWYDSPRRSRRLMAAVLLALATVFKIVPCLAGLLYLRKRTRQSLALAAFSGLLALVLLLVPFLFCGGWSGVSLWMRNAAENSQTYAHMNGIGVFGLVGEIARVFGCRHEVLNVVGPYVRAGSVLLALLCLAASLLKGLSEKKAVAVVVLGLLFLPPTMMIYVTLYVLPILFALAFDEDRLLRRSCWISLVAICLPVNVPLLGGSFNGLFAAAGLVDCACQLLRRASGCCDLRTVMCRQGCGRDECASL